MEKTITLRPSSGQKIELEINSGNLHLTVDGVMTLILTREEVDTLYEEIDGLNFEQ